MPQPKVKERVSPPPQRARTVNRPAERFYVPQLDGLRFVAFLLVFWHHVPETVFGALLPAGPLQALALRASRFGWIGVDLFFCLSSFLITTLLMREYDATGALSLRRFYIRRALRIWPLYYLVLLLIFAVFPIWGVFGPLVGTEWYSNLLSRHLFPAVVFLGNFSYALFTNATTIVFSPLWSISIEEQFYLVWPVFLSFVPRLQRKTIWSLFVGLLVFTFLVRFYITVNGIAYPMVWVNTLARLDPLLLGTAVAFAYRFGRTSLPGWLALLGSVGTYTVLSGFPQLGQSWHQVWQLAASGVASALLLWAILKIRFASLLLGNPLMRWGGKLSYGFYLFHMIGLILGGRFAGSHTTFAGPAQAAVFLAGALGSTLAVGAVSYYAYERWFLLLKDRFAIVPSRTV